MQKFSQQLTLHCDNGAEALKKLRKLMKRGCTDDPSNTDFNNLSGWNTQHAEQYSDAPCYLVIHTCGGVLILGHTGSGHMINRVRDVENYRAK